MFWIWARHDWKRSAFDVFDTFATQSGLVHDVTDADPWAWNGSTRGHVFADLKKRDQKSVKNCSVSVFLLFHYYLHNLWCFSLRLPYNNCFRGFLYQSWWKQTLIMLCALQDPPSEAFWTIFSFGVPFPSPCEGGIYTYRVSVSPLPLPEVRFAANYSCSYFSPDPDVGSSQCCFVPQWPAVLLEVGNKQVSVVSPDWWRCRYDCFEFGEILLPPCQRLEN